MKINGEEFTNGDIVLVKYKNIFGMKKDFVGFFFEKPILLGGLLVDFGLSFIHSENRRGGFDVGFKIKRVISIKKLK